MIEKRKTGPRQAAVGVLVGLTALAAVLILYREKSSFDAVPPPAADVATAQPAVPSDPPESLSNGNAPPRAPISAQQLAERARRARNVTPHNALASRRNEGQSPCAELMGVWQFDGGEQLSLQAAGNATWKDSAARAPESVHWICMQDGHAEVMKAKGTLRLTRDASSDLLSVSDAQGGHVDSRRATASRAP